MTPEEKFNLYIWWLLKRIKDEHLATTSNTPVEFHTGNVEYLDGSGIPSIDKRNKLMLKLQELGAIKILEEPRYIIGTGTIFVIEVLQPKFDEIYKKFNPSLETTQAEKSPSLSVAEKKKLYILEKLKEEWDLTPQKNENPTMIQAGLYFYERSAGETRVSQQKFSAWERECGISDWYELENILTIFKQEGLIINFSIHNEYE